MLTRIISGVIGIAIATAIIQWGGFVFAAFGMILGIGAWREYCNAFAQKDMKLPHAIGVICVALICASANSGPGAILGSAVFSVLILLLLPVLRNKTVSAMEACVSVAGVLCFGLAFSHLIMLRLSGSDSVINTSLGDFQLGCALVWIMFIGTWASDTFAYFTGYAFGKHKLCPVISPKKTIEGFIGGLVGTTASVAGLGAFFGFNIPLMAVLGFCVCIIATLGDLVESVMKRYTGIKDSGTLIPGHGGIWDRFDSVIYTAPFVYYFVQNFCING